MKKLKLLFVSLILIFSSCDQDNEKNNSISVFNNEIDTCIFDLLNLHNDNNVTSKPNAAIINWPRWKTGQIIKIKFLNGDSALQEQVKKYAKEWTIYANLTFEYVPVTEYADIRIGFNWDGKGGSSSELGMNSTSATYNYQNLPSMRFGWISLPNETTAKRSILHEFGHALGLIHEQISPASTISWDLPKVYKYYSDLMGFTKEETDQFVITKYSASQTNYSEYDKLSIMHYYIDPDLTTDGVGVSEMNELSMTDVTYINKWYPFTPKSIIESGERIDLVTWTKSIKSPNGQYSLNFDHGILYILDLATNKRIWKVGDDLYSYVSSCYLNTDGNITITGRSSGFAAPDYTTWTSNTSEFPGAELYLQDDGNLVLLYNETIKWSSKNGKV